MFIARSFVHGRMYGVLHVASQESALAVMIGSMGLEEWGDDCMSRLLIEAVGALSGRLDDDLPVRLADALLTRLGVEGNPSDRPSWVLYAAALLRQGVVEVCHSGDLRVQLVRDGAVERWTVDHTLANHGPPETAEQYDPMGNVVVRSLNRRDGPPERATWPFDGVSRLVISSSEVHRHRARDQPILWPGDQFVKMNHAGAVVEIDADAVTADP